MEREKILVSLPSPMGDAVMCTPALRALRKRFADASIYFLANDTVKQCLSPSGFNDQWVNSEGAGVFGLGLKLRRYNFSKVILFKNSFGSALTAALSGTKERIGYIRDGRGVFLTEKLYPLRDSKDNFKPVPMIDYYLGIAERLGCEIDDRRMELSIDPADAQSTSERLERFLTSAGPVVILVPGGAFGPSKMWPAEKFAAVADWLIEKYNAGVMVSVAPNDVEKKVAQKICDLSKGDIYNLGEKGLSIGQLKACLAKADLVITNDTGPRHIAIALKRKVITLFGPNEPAWTQTGYDNEIQIIGQAPCAPCEKPKCKKQEHICMKAITVEMIREAIENSKL